MSTLRTMGMNTSRAQCKRAIPAAVATTTSVTLRSLTSIGAVVSGSGSRARRIRSCARSAIRILRRYGETGPCLQRFVDGHRCFRTLSGSNNCELHVARCVANDIQAWEMRLAQVARFHHATSIHLATKASREVALLTLA